LNLLEYRDECGEIVFRGISLLENGKRISEISDQISGGEEEAGKCDEEENFSVLRWRGCGRNFCGKSCAWKAKRKEKDYTEKNEDPRPRHTLRAWGTRQGVKTRRDVEIEGRLRARKRDYGG